MKKRIKRCQWLCFTVLLLFFVLFFTGCSRDEEILMEDPAIREADGISEEGPYEEEGSVPEKEDGPESVYVYVTGAVNAPGVYEVSADARLFKVIEEAGGFREDAAVDSLNLAELVQDGAYIKVYSLKEYEEASGTGQEAGGAAGMTGNRDSGGSTLININRASLTELTGINGIGESRAQAIITYREEKGAFSRIEDIKKVPGIKDGLFNKIRDQITV